ncbi:hypothetical protein TNIN_374571 [Trichonephila inaurata madagascariensis]|uniref:Uncharacterized protein n=1 Tax=Trichonephila inaurata madagascariensis TaxID=2747483 RepID=A0A8X6YWC0_9ARAC|nr:hypothetical protein TNIN_374571 [Trichonephila inaurata madagascariensis]
MKVGCLLFSKRVIGKSLDFIPPRITLQKGPSAGGVGILSVQQVKFSRGCRWGGILSGCKSLSRERKGFSRAEVSGVGILSGSGEYKLPRFNNLLAREVKPLEAIS